MDLSVAIQAGGESRRMGRNKALVQFLGRPLIERVVARLSGIAAEVLVTTNQPGALTFLNLPCFEDLLPGMGALGGLYTALSCASFPYVGVVACDMPFANSRLLAAEWEMLVTGSDDVVIPGSVEGLEPLHAVYRRQTCLPAIQTALAAGERKVISWFPNVKVRVLSPAEWQAYDPEGQAFININTPEELRQAEALACPD